MKNKLIGLTAVMMTIVLIAPVMAQTTVDTFWEGSGFLNTSFVAGDDARSDFWTSGSSISGVFHAKDFDDNLYSYGVDTTDSFVKASVTGWGSGKPDSYMKFEVKRLDSHLSMYGNAGQRSYTEIWTDGTAEMSWGSRTNYAEMSNCQYSRTPKTTNGKNFEATGNHYIYHELTDADGDGAAIEVYGYGETTSKIKLQGEKAGGKDSYFNFGSLKVCGDGCAWQNNYATFEGSGKGDFLVHAWADNGLTIGCPDCGSSWSIPGDGTNNSATYDLHVGYAGEWSYPDFGVRGH